MMKFYFPFFFWSETDSSSSDESSKDDSDVAHLLAKADKVVAALEVFIQHIQSMETIYAAGYKLVFELYDYS
jgi:hypothetical protein